MSCGTTYAAYATNFGPGGGFSRWTNRFWHMSNSLDILGLIQIGQDSGASKYVGKTYQFHTGQNAHYLCGNDAGINTAHRIFAGQ